MSEDEHVEMPAPGTTPEPRAPAGGDAHPDSDVEAPAEVPGEARIRAALFRAESEGGGRRGDLSPETAGYRQRRLAARQNRRRRLLRRGLLAVVVVAVVIALALLLASLIGPSGSNGEPARSADADGAAPAVILTLDEGQEIRAAVLVASTGGRPVIVGMPGSTLLAGPAGFESLDALLRDKEPADVGPALDSLLGVEPQLVTASWAGLRRALADAGDGEAWPEALPAGAEGAALAADAVGALAVRTTEEKGRRAAEDLNTDGDGAAEFLRALTAAAAEPVVASLPGRLVEGMGYTYYEPDLAQTRLLVGNAAGGTLSVEVQNGSGVVGVTEAATAVLTPLGYRMLPPRNADRFPDVADTQILASKDSLGEAGRIQAALGVGRVVEQKDVPSRRVLVILGKDALPERLTTTTVAPGGTTGTAATVPAGTTRP